MNLLIDESVDRQVVEKLREDGHNVLYVSDLDPVISDEIVLSTATSRSSSSRGNGHMAEWSGHRPREASRVGEVVSGGLIG